MKKLILCILLIGVSNISYSQIIIEDDISDLWPKDLIVKNKIKKITFLSERGDSIVTVFRIDGQKEIEYLISANGKDTSIVKYIYNNNLLKNSLHILSEGDTLTNQEFMYNGDKLIEKIDHTNLFNNIDIIQYFYNKEGGLIEIEEEYTSDYSYCKITKTIDKKGRIAKAYGIDKDKGEFEINYSYLDKKLIINKLDSKTIIDYNESEFPIASRNYLIEENKEILETTLQFIYNKSNLLEFIIVDFKSDAKVEYTKWED